MSQRPVKPYHFFQGRFNMMRLSLSENFLDGTLGWVVACTCGPVSWCRCPTTCPGRAQWTRLKYQQAVRSSTTEKHISGRRISTKLFNKLFQKDHEKCPTMLRLFLLSKLRKEAEHKLCFVSKDTGNNDTPISVVTNREKIYQDKKRLTIHFA